MTIGYIPEYFQTLTPLRVVTPEPCPVEIGDTVRIIPAANFDHSAGFGEILREPIPATVIQIQEEHRWYRVRYTIRPGCIGYECFKF